MNTKQVPPHDLAAEESVLGSALISKTAAEMVADRLSAEDYFSEKHRLIHRAIVELVHKGETPATLAVADVLRRKDLLERIGDVAYLISIEDTTPNARNVETYLGLVNENAVRRRLGDQASRLLAAAQSGEGYEEAAAAILPILEGRVVRSRQLVSALDLSQKEFEPMRWILPGLLTTGLTYLASRPKVGKSWMALDVARAVALDGEVLGLKAGLGEVLFLGLEDSERRLRDRLSILLDGNTAPDNLYFSTTWRKFPAGLDDLMNEVRSRPALRMVVIDTIGRVRERARPGGNCYEEDVAALSPLQAAAHEQDIAILVVHHERKSSNLQDVFESISGSHGTSGTADTLWVLHRDRGSSSGTLHVTGRDVEEVSIALDFDGGRWRALGLEEAVGSSPERREIIDILRDAGPMGPRAVAVRLGKAESTVKTLLRRMADSGEIVKLERGRYFAPPAESAAWPPGV
ncbi:MAG: AAA family ATPase [Actinobacteria bacterium]|nr:AAA family ATPase [Actinomycetota bacterium]MBU1942897.1 AAA family ATPase [Actinomycetota bacterium]MBU2687629.1 AAA family ATPase [Actinomycetota bacterium]